jgi:hypothetical protein
MNNQNEYKSSLFNYYCEPFLYNNHNKWGYYFVNKYNENK